MNSIYAKTIYTGKTIQKNSYVVFNGKTVVGISEKKKGKLLGKYPVITPAFIDAHSHIGMMRAGEPSGEGEINEQMDSIQALPDALDSVQMDDTSFKNAVEGGVLYSCVLPGSGNIIGGLSAVIRNYAKTSTQALIKRAGVKAAFGYNPCVGTISWKGQRPTTRMGAASILRSKLDSVAQKIQKQKKAKGKKKEDIEFSIEEKVIRDILLKKHILRVHVHKIDDIALLLRIVDEYKIKVTVEHASDVHEPEIFRELKKRKIPVVSGPYGSIAYKVELKHENYSNIKHIIDEKVRFGLMTDHPVILTELLFLQTKWFLKYGLSKQEAVELISRNNAEILGIDNILGSLYKGKWASFTCWNGNPFDITNYPVAVYGEGELLYSE